MNSETFTDVIAFVLRAGIFASFAAIIAGMVLIFVKGQADGYPIILLSNTEEITGQLTSQLLPPSGIFHGLVTLDGAYYVALGIWILVFTPVAVLLVSLYHFLRSRNGTYSIITVIVIVNLFIAMFIIR